jgi:hypothetical protein
MRIELVDYEHTCADGCCTTYGYDVYINGEKIGSTNGYDALEVVELLNKTFGGNNDR